MRGYVLTGSISGGSPNFACKSPDGVKDLMDSWMHMSGWTWYLFVLGCHSLTPKYQTAYACEGKKLTIECGEGNFINLIRANYGRFSITICNDHGNVDWSVNCMFPKSLPVLNSKCANKASCTVLATTSMFGDPCPGTHKYLEAHYQCVSAAQTLTTTNRPSPPVVHSNNMPMPVLPPLLANGSTIINGAHIPPPPRMPPPFIALAPSSSSSGPPTIPQPTGTRLRTTPSSSTDTATKAVGSPAMPAHSPPPVVHHHGHGGNSVIRPPIPASGLGGEHIVLGAPKPTVVASSASPTATSTQPAHKAASMPTVHSSSPPNTRILSGVGGVPGLDERATQQQQTQHQQKTNLATVGGATNLGGVRTTVNNINTANISEAEANMLCVAMTVRNLYWNTTRVGDVNVQPCPAGSTGIAKWRCVLMKRLNDVDGDLLSPPPPTTTMRSLDCANGTCDAPMVMANKLNEMRNFEPTWHPLTPDLTQCRSLWLNNLEMRVNQPDSSLISIANDLSEVTSSKILYGGDMLVTTKIIQTMSEKMYHDKETFPDQRQREAIIMELLHGVVKTGSNLLDESQLSSWQDLNQEDQMRVATSLLTGLEYNAFLLADTIIRERNVVQKVKNILLSVRVLETKNIQSNEVFPEPDQWHISDDRIELPRVSLIENSEGGLVRIVFAAFDRLESILKPSYDHFDLKSARTYVKTTANVNNDTDPDSSGASQRLRILNSKVISASLGKGRHIQLSQPIKLVLKHIKTENVTNPTCVFWNYIDHSWSANGCSLESTNRTHSICMCNHLTNFAILMDVMDEHTHSLFTMFDGNMRILIYISVLVCVIFILIALLTLKIFNGVFIKTTRTLIYRNIYVCLLCNEIIFLIGLELSDTNMLCGFTTMFTHLFVFATMAWFCFEAFQSYTILTTDDMILEDQNCKVNCYYLISYGLSISTVALALFIKASSYTACDFCVLMAEDNLFYFSFLAPVAMFLLGAIVYIFLSWLIMCRKSRTTLKNKEHTRLANVRFDIRCSFIFLVLLVAVWISGYFYLRLAKMDDDRAVVCGYLFVGFNTVMGFYIFVFHCIQNEKIRREYRKYVRQNAWLPKCLRCSKTSISSGMGCGSGVSGGAAAQANSGGTLAGGTLGGTGTLGAASQMKHKVPIEAALDNEEAGIMTEDAIVATSDCELNESVGAQSVQTRRTAGGTLKSMTKPLGSAGILPGSLVKGDPKLAGPGATGTIRSTGGGVGLQTPSIGHTSPTSSVGSTQLIFGHGHKHHVGQGAPGGGAVNMNANNAEAYYYHPDYYSWTAGRQHQAPGPPGMPGGLSPQHHHMQQQPPHEIFYWTQKHNANSKKKKRGSSATTGPDSPSGSLHSRTTAAASQQVLFYPSYKKTAGPPRGGHPQYAQYAEAIEPYYQQQQQQQPQYERRHHKPQGGPYLQQQHQQQQLSSDDEQIESAAHAHLLHLGRRGGSQLPPLPPAAMGPEFGGGQHRNYRNKHSCDLNPKYDESGVGHRANSGEQAYYNHGSMTSGGEGPVYEEILSNRSSDVQHYDVGDDDEDDVAVGRAGQMMMVGGMPVGQRGPAASASRRHRSRRSHMHHAQQAQAYRDDDDDDEDGDDDDGRDDDESLGEDEEGVYDPEGVMPQNTQERMHRLMAMQDEDFQRRFQRQQRKNAMNQDYQQQQQRDFDVHPQQPGQVSSHPHYPESNAIFGVVSNASGGGGSVRSFKKTSPSHHARGGVLEHFTHGPPLPPGNQQQQMAQQQQQQQHPVGRNISAMLDENNTVRCYLEPLNK